jgi:hypothetical protein
MIINNPDLTQEEINALVEAIADITILIGGADGKIDKNEIEWSEKVTQIRSYSLPENLQAFYQEVGKNFSDTLNGLITELPDDVEARTEILEGKLAALNPILAKLPQREGAELYHSYVSFAKHVAKASGGFLGFWSISYEESKFMGLPVLNKIEFPRED